MNEDKRIEMYTYLLRGLITMFDLWIDCPWEELTEHERSTWLSLGRYALSGKEWLDSIPSEEPKSV